MAEHVFSDAAQATCRSSYRWNFVLSRTFPFSLCVHVKHSLGSRASYGFTLRAVPAIGELDFHVQITLLVLLSCSVLWSVCKMQVRLVMQMAAAVLLVIANAQ